MTAKRWELIRALAGAGPVTIREAARRVERDVKAVHGDVHALLKAGVLHKTEDRLIVSRSTPSMLTSCCAQLERRSPHERSGLAGPRATCGIGQLSPPASNGMIDRTG
jgi:hypothetical protein